MNHATAPRRPRVLGGLATLRRSADEIQIGLEPGQGIVIGNLPEAVADTACDLDGRVGIEQLLDRTPPDLRGPLLALLDELASRGLLEDGPSTARSVPGRLAADATTWRLRTGFEADRLVTARKQARVVVHGTGRLAVGVATMLATAGIGAVHAVATGTVSQEEIGCGYLPSDIGRPRSAALVDAIRRCDPSVATDEMPLHTADLVIITDALVPAPELVDSLLREAVPHLVVRIREETGIVGPFVIAGRTSCLGCADLHRAELDGCWPTIAAQLAGSHQVADLSCSHATAALATEQALRALTWLSAGGPPPPTWDNTIELNIYRGTIGHRPWSPHPHCRCGALERPAQDTQPAATDQKSPK